MCRRREPLTRVGQRHSCHRQGAMLRVSAPRWVTLGLGVLLVVACGQPPQPPNNGGSHAVAAAAPTDGAATRDAGGAAGGVTTGAGATGAAGEARPEVATLNLASV